MRHDVFTNKDGAGIEWRYSVVPTTGEYTRVRVTPHAATPQIPSRSSDSGQKDDFITQVPEGADPVDFMARWVLNAAHPNSAREAERILGQQFPKAGISDVFEAALLASHRL